MPTIRTLQRLVLAGTLTLMTSLASAGNGSSSSSSSGGNDNGELLMIILGLAVASSIDCTSDDPFLCSGGFREIFIGQPKGAVQMQKGGQLQKAN